MKKLVLIVVLVFSFCHSNSNNYENIKMRTKIDSIKLIHWGKGYYKTELYYKFKFNNKLYTTSKITKELSRSYNSIYKKNDSIVITFPSSNTNNSRILRKIN